MLWTRRLRTPSAEVIVYRAFPHLSQARPGESGHPLYLYKPQGKGRADNPREYDAWYFAMTPEAAVGEVRGDLVVWRNDSFSCPFLPGGRYALGRFHLPDDIPLLNLDDARNLLDRGLRPTQVVARNRPTTQSMALNVFRESNADGSRKWAGLRWWSFQRPHWTVLVIWVAPGEDTPHRFMDAQDLDLAHPAVMDAAASLGKLLVP